MKERPWLIRVWAQLRVLLIPVPHRQRRVLQRRVRRPADQLHQLRPVRFLLRQPAQHPGVCNPTNLSLSCCLAYTLLQATTQSGSLRRAVCQSPGSRHAACWEGRGGIAASSKAPYQ